MSTDVQADHRIRIHLAELLARRGMKVTDLGEAVGIHPNNLHRLKGGDVSFIRLNTLSELCRVLECQPGDLLTYES